MRKISRCPDTTACIAMLFLMAGGSPDAEPDTSRPATLRLFADDTLLAITIEGPLSKIMRDRDESDEYPATLRYSDDAGTPYDFDIKLRVRGKFRRQRHICSFAPLRVNFKKKQVQGTLFAGQDKIKLVTDCQRSSRRYQQLLLKEYLAYKILNLLTDRSFGARLLRVTYVNTDRRNRSRDSYAFFIEAKEHIADRLGMKLLELDGTEHVALDPAYTNLINVFQYLIGNTDFSLVAGPDGTSCCHNAVLYGKKEEALISIPYDFDHAGIVDAPYAEPNPAFSIRSVTTRVYRGRCANNALLDSTLGLFADKRGEITKLVGALPGLDDRSVRDTLDYIDEFFADVSSRESIEKNIIGKCT